MSVSSPPNRSNNPRAAIGDLRRQLRSRLQRAGVPDADISTDVLLEHVLKARPGSLARHQRDVLEESQLKELESLISRREKREPLQYLIGTWGFLDLDLAVAPGALIPRPETEDWLSCLFEEITQQDWPAHWQFVDVGTGTGAIGLATARRFPCSHGLLVDISVDALPITVRNCALHHAESDRLSVCRADLASACRTASLHLIVANPPYIPSHEIEGLMPEVRQFEPRLALDGGFRGLNLVTRLLNDAARVLLPGGLIAIEHGQGQRDSILALTPSALSLRRTIDDAGRRDRAIIWQKPSD